MGTDHLKSTGDGAPTNDPAVAALRDIAKHLGRIADHLDGWDGIKATTLPNDHPGASIRVLPSLGDDL